MARNDSGETVETGETGTNGASTAVKDPGMMRTDFAFGLPVAMKAEIELAAQKENITPAFFVKRLVANAIGHPEFAPAESAKAPSAQSDDAKKAALKLAEQKKRLEAKTALDDYRARLGVKVAEKAAGEATAPVAEEATA